MFSIKSVPHLIAVAIHDLKVGAKKAEAGARLVLVDIEKFEPTAERIADVVAKVVPGAEMAPTYERAGEAAIASILHILDAGDAAAEKHLLDAGLDQALIDDAKSLLPSIKALIPVAPQPTNAGNAGSITISLKS